VLVERAAHLRGEQRALLTLEPPDEALGAFAHASGPDEDMEAVPGLGPIVTSLEDVPAIHVDGVVLANELLDDLPVHLVERGPTGWAEVRVGIDEGALDEVLIPAPPSLSAEADEVAAGVEVPTGARLPVPIATRAWLERVAALLRDGEVVLVDYADEIQGLLERGPNGPNGWLRTYRAHGRGSPPLDAPGSQDITTDVPLEYLRSMARRSGFIVADETDQREWLHRLGIDELVADGTRTWEERAHVGDLAAIAGRSRATEAAALTDPNGLGAHRVVTLQGGAASGATGDG
jgi:SAM-dependent MidA family methyltransferase